MVTEREAWILDKVRKALTFLVAAAGTWLLLRVLYRLAQGTQHLWDPELLAFLVLACLAVVWVRAAQRVPRRRASSPAKETSESTGEGS